MVRIRRMILVLASAVVAALVMAPPALAATTTAETGPLTPHEPQTYVWNLGPNANGDCGELTNKATGEHIAWGIDNGKCPILLPGDSFEVIPQPNEPNGNMAKGLYIGPNEHYPDVNHWESRGPIEVTSTESHGDNNYIFITGFTIVGDYPVRIWSNSGGDCAATRVSDDVSYTFRKSDLAFSMYVPSVALRYEYWSNRDDGGRFFTDEELAGAATYTDEENPTLIYAEDALVNRYAESNETLGLTVYRPYIEGYLFAGGNACWENNSDIYSYRGAAQLEEWQDGHVEIFPQWKNPLGEEQALNGSDDDYLLMRYQYNYGRTLTLDAMGGTIDGYPTRIYEAMGALDLEAMDEAYAARTAWIPEREGWFFCGWYTDEACTQPMEGFKAELDKYDGNSANLAERACHLYAKWDRPSFVDVDSNNDGSHGPDIEWMARTGISEGWTLADGTKVFKGMDNVARCDFAAFLYRLEDVMDDGERNNSCGLTAQEVEATLKGVSDCTTKTPHAAEVAWMIKRGISTGWPEKGKKTVKFKPLDNVARQDMAAFLYRFADLWDNDEQDKSLAMGAEQIVFSDVTPGDATNHADEVVWLASVGVTKGWDMGDGTYQFRGTNKVKRQDMAAFMHRMHTYLLHVAPRVLDR